MSAVITTAGQSVMPVGVRYRYQIRSYVCRIRSDVKLDYFIWVIDCHAFSSAIYADKMGDRMRDSDWPQRFRIESFHPALQTSVERLIEKYNQCASSFYAPIAVQPVAAIQKQRTIDLISCPTPLVLGFRAFQRQKRDYQNQDHNDSPKQLSPWPVVLLSTVISAASRHIDRPCSET